METIKKLILPFILVNLLILDGAVIYAIINFSTTLVPATAGPPPPNLGGGREVVPVDQCGTECQKYVQDQLALYKVPTPQPTSRSVVATAPTHAQITSVSYVPVPGSGSTTANDWADLAGTDFYFNLSDYPGLQSIYFETNIRLLNGNGQAYVRLFDVTHSIGVQGSEASTASQTSTAVASGQVSFWQGRILLRVQAKSLTADTAIFDSGRLKITTRN